MGGLISVLGGGLIYVMMGGLIIGLSEWVGWLSNGVVFGLIFDLTMKKIETLETLKFSLKKSRAGLVYGLMVGLILGLIGMPALVLIQVNWGLYWGLRQVLLFLIKVMMATLITGLILGLMGALIFGLIQGISGGEIEVKNSPNQGTKETNKNAIRLTAFSLIFLIVISLLIQNSQISSLGGIILIITGVEVITMITILYSIYSLIQHFSLRLVLWLSGYAPWNYARFLDYATDRLFLQRVGGGYRFIHRLLQEHFAQFWQPEIELFFIPDSDKQIKTQQIKKRSRKTLPRLSRLEQFVISLLKNYQKAIADYTQAIKIEPDFDLAYYNIGLIKYEIGSIDEAIRQWQEAINLHHLNLADPNRTHPAQLALAVAFYVKGEQEKAFQMAEAVLKLDKRFADLEFLKENLWGERLLADGQKLFSTPRIQGFLSSE